MGTDDGERSRSHRLPDYSSQKISRRRRRQKGGRGSIVLGRFFPGLPFSPFFHPSILPDSFLFSPIFVAAPRPLPLGIRVRRGMWCLSSSPPPSFLFLCMLQPPSPSSPPPLREGMSDVSTVFSTYGSQSMPRRRDSHASTLVRSSRPPQGSDIGSHPRPQ